jgi:RHS repeat-associated protein
MRTKMNVQQMISLGMAILMAHPALMAGAPVPSGPSQSVRPVALRARSVAAAAAVSTPITRRPVAAQALTALSGESVTTLPDGRVLILGGQNGAAAVARAALKPAAGVAAQLAVTLRNPRAFHTATVLPDGQVLVLGGLDRNGLVNDAELFDPNKQTFDSIVSGLEARAYHTTTLFTDGRVLIAGGINANGQPMNRLDLWNPKTRSIEPFNQQLKFARRGHTAKLQADGNVRISGGVTAAGLRVDQDEVIEVGDGAAQSDELHVAASIPAADATEVATDVRIAVRFSRPLQVITVSAVTVTLRDEAGPVFAKVVAAEGGMLAFVTPDSALNPNTRYTLSIMGGRDAGDFVLPPSDIRFTTADAPISQSGQPKSAPKDKDDPPPPPLQALTGITALYGHSRTSLGKYLPGVTLNLDCAGKTATATTDSQGRFLLISTQAGHCELEIDGTTARDPGKEYGRFYPGVDLVAGRTNVLPYTIWMTALDKKEVTIPSPTTGDTVITHPGLKGLELHLPANTVIRDQKTGQVITKITLSPVPIGRPPFPLPEGVAVPFYFTIQPGGAYVEVGGSRYSPGKGAQLVYPNRGRAPAGYEFNFWDYDADGRGWYIYGKGKVDANRKSIVPDPNVVIYRFTGAMVAGDCCGPWPPPPRPRCGSGGLPPSLPECQPDPCPDCRADPVVPSTGLFYLEQTDLALPDVIPVVLTRVFRPSYLSGPFGIGSTNQYEIYLVTGGSGYAYIDMILPDGGRVHYTRTSAGTAWYDAVLEHNTTSSPFYKSIITWNGNGWDLTFKNGTVYTFPESSGAPAGTRSAISRVKDRYGNAITMTRNPGTGVLQKITSPNGRWISFTYDSANRITQAQDNGGRTYTYQYDEGGRLTQVTDPMNGVTQYTYDANNQMITMVEPRNIILNIPRFTNEYNAEGRVFRQTAADGGIYQFNYTEDANGNIIQTDVTNPRAFVTRYTYDSNGYFSGGYAIAETRALGMPEQQVTTYQRQSGSNLVLSVIDALNRNTAYTYDPDGNVLSLTKLAGTSQAVTSSYTYGTAYSRTLTSTDPLNHTTQYTYDPVNGALLMVTDPLNRQTNLTYYPTGQVNTINLPTLAQTRYSYASGDLISITNELGQTTSRFADSIGRTVTSTDQLGNITRLEYDPLNSLLKRTDALQNATALTYDANANRTTLTDPRSGLTRFSSEIMNRPSSRIDPLPSQKTDTFQYDIEGNLITYTDRKGQTTSSSYDALDRPSLVTFSDSSTITITYDAANRATQISDSLYGIITKAYDGFDRLITETSPLGSIAYTYDDAGRRTSMTVAGQPAVSYSYDASNRLTRIERGSPVTAVDITYDNAGRVSTHILTNSGTVVCTVVYSYDAASRVTQITYQQGGGTLGTLTYDYDAAGRRTSVGGSFARIALSPGTGTVSYNANNQLTQWTGQSLTYDFNGNLVNDGANTFTWNARNQLTAITGPGVSAGFQYDPLGRRISRSINGVSASYLYDGSAVVQELSGGGVGANILNGLGVDDVLARIEPSSAYVHLRDALGSTVALLNAAGQVSTEYTYEPFGASTSTGSTNSNSRQFTNRDNDGTGLYYYRARYYSPRLQRFISEDPIDYLGGINLYAYTANDPINASDPSGLMAYICTRQAWPDGIGGGVGNHQYFWTESPRQSCARGEGNFPSGSERGKSGGDVCVPIPDSDGKEQALMKCCENSAGSLGGSPTSFRPSSNNCQTMLQECVGRIIGIYAIPKLPGGLLGPRCDGCKSPIFPKWRF